MLYEVITTVSIADTVLKRLEFIFFDNETFVNENPSVALSDHQIESLKIERKLEANKMLPDISIGYFSQTMVGDQEINGVPRVFGNGDRFTGIQAGIAIPLFFGSDVAKIKGAKIKEQMARTGAENFRKTMIGSYQRLISEQKKLLKSVEYYETQAVPEADMIISQTTLSYRTGALDYLDYIQNLSRALTIKQNYLDALNNYNQTIINLEFITGKEK